MHARLGVFEDGEDCGNENSAFAGFFKYDIDFSSPVAERAVRGGEPFDGAEVRIRRREVGIVRGVGDCEIFLVQVFESLRETSSLEFWGDERGINHFEDGNIMLAGSVVHEEVRILFHVRGSNEIFYG